MRVRGVEGDTRPSNPSSCEQNLQILMAIAGKDSDAISIPDSIAQQSFRYDLGSFRNIRVSELDMLPGTENVVVATVPRSLLVKQLADGQIAERRLFRSVYQALSSRHMVA